MSRQAAVPTMAPAEIAEWMAAMRAHAPWPPRDTRLERRISPAERKRIVDALMLVKR